MYDDEQELKGKIEHYLNHFHYSIENAEIELKSGS